MPYVVKAVSTNGTVAWLGCDPDGIPSVSIRENATIFPSVQEAGKALAKMPHVPGLVVFFEDSDGESATHL